jgi:hypothetical protein
MKRDSRTLLDDEAIPHENYCRLAVPRAGFRLRRLAQVSAGCEFGENHRTRQLTGRTGPLQNPIRSRDASQCFAGAS